MRNSHLKREKGPAAKEERNVSSSMSDYAQAAPERPSDYPGQARERCANLGHQQEWWDPLVDLETCG